MSAFEVVKALHILSATLIFGTGLGSAFFLWRAHQSNDLASLAFAARTVVLADWLFTTPAIVFQPLSGLWLADAAGYRLSENWLLWTYGLFLLAGACWLPVVRIQLRVRDLTARGLAAQGAPPETCARLLRAWFWLGWPAFLAIVVIVFLMVARPT